MTSISPKAKPEIKMKIKLETKPKIKSETKSKNEDVKSSSLVMEIKKEENIENSFVSIQAREQHVRLGRLYLLSIIEKLETNVVNFPELQKWIEEFKRIDELNTIPQVMVGLYGATGAGKSSVLNALLEKKLLHSNPMRAGTSVVTLVSYNFDTDKNHRYRAEIQTVTEKEWKSELEILFADIRELSTEEIYNASSRSDAGVAIAKIRAVYPFVVAEELELWSPAKLIAKLDAGDVLGRTHTFKAPSAKKLRRVMNKFINSRVTDDETDARKPAYWPLVREGHLFVKVEWLRPGIVLVDLPGVADSNAARCVIAENYIRNLNAMWVVAPINRGTDDKTAWDLLDVSFKRQAKLDGKFNQQHVSFILTKTDDVNVGEVEDELDLKRTKWWKNQNSELKTLNAEKSKKIKERKKMYKKREFKRTERGKIIKQIKKNIILSSETEHTNEVSKRRSPGSETTNGSAAKTRKLGEQSARVDTQRFDESRDLTALSRQLAKDIKLLGSKTKKLNDQIEQSRCHIQHNLAQTRQFCIEQRNDWSCKEMRSKFMEEIRQFEVDLAEEQIEQKQHPKEKENKNGRHYEEDDKSDALTAHEYNAKKVAVLCVSSKAYDSLQGRNKKEDQIKGFFGLDDTGIPQLRKHCVQASIPEREKATSNFLTEIKLVNESLSKWAAHTSSEIRISTAQRKSLQQVFKTCTIKFDQLTDESHRHNIDSLKRQTMGEVCLLLKKAISKAKDFSMIIVLGWFQKGPSKIPWNTLKALCVRDGGPYTADNGITYNLNKCLLDNFLGILIVPWDELFNTKARQCLDPYMDTLFKAIDNLLSKLLQGVRDIHPDLTIILGMKMSSASHLQHMAKNHVVEAFRKFRSTAQVINRTPQRIVQICLQHMYQACGVDSGVGVYRRNECRILKTIEKARDTIFSKVAMEVGTDLWTNSHTFAKALREVSQIVIFKVKKEWNTFLDAATVAKLTDGPRPDKVALQNVLKAYISDWHKALAGEKGVVLVFATADQIVELEREPKLQLIEVDDGFEDADKLGSNKCDESDGSDETDRDGQMVESVAGNENGFECSDEEGSDKLDGSDEFDYDGQMDESHAGAENLEASDDSEDDCYMQI